MLVKMSSPAGTDGVKMRREVCAKPHPGELPLFDLSGSWLLNPTLFKLADCKHMQKHCQDSDNYFNSVAT